MISYAQNAEDVLIHRFFQDQPAGFYVDVGAGHPEFQSVTKHFYDSGWCGINFEPRTKVYEELRKSRPRDVNIRMAISNCTSSASFYEVEVEEDTSDDNGGLSTLNSGLAELYASRGYRVSRFPLQVNTLSNVFYSLGISEVAFLKIDVEGHELEVVQGLDWRRWRPRLVVMENTIPTTQQLASPAASNYLQNSGYVLAFFDGLNQFLVREEDRHRAALIKTPANVFDRYLTSEHLRLMNEVQRLTQQLGDMGNSLQHKDQLLQRLQIELCELKSRVGSRTDQPLGSTASLGLKQPQAGMDITSAVQ